MGIKLFGKAFISLNILFPNINLLKKQQTMNRFEYKTDKKGRNIMLRKKNLISGVTTPQTLEPATSVDPQDQRIEKTQSLFSDFFGGEKKEHRNQEYQEERKKSPTIHHLRPKNNQKLPSQIQMIKKKKSSRDRKREIRGHGQLGFFSNKDTWGNQHFGKDWILQQNKRQKFDIKNIQGVIDIGKELFDDEQVVYIEPSEAERKLQQLRIRGQPFIDDKFPANQRSLMGDQFDPNWSKITWKPISKLMPEAQLFVDKIEPMDIKQGMLGNCYFLAGLAALSERPDRIFNLFLLHEKNPQKYYSVKILYRGKWKRIDLDEYVPVLGKNLIFSRSNQNETWVIMMEKAWAKLYGSYKQTQAGFPVEPLHDLTGAPIKKIFLHSKNFDKEVEWQYLLKASEREYAMVASSNPGSDSNKSENGVHQGHAYTFLNALYLNLGGKHEKLVQLRNPWGAGEFKGKWSDYDSNWNWVPAHEKKRLHFTKNTKDGIFFMTYDDFIAEFSNLTVAQINDNASYVYCSKKDPQNQGVYFSVLVKKEGKYSFQVSKTPERSYTGLKAKKFQYPDSILKVIRVDTPYPQTLGGTVTRRSILFNKLHLVPGEYVARVQIDYDPQFETDFEVTLAIYSEYSCSIRLATKSEINKSKGQTASTYAQTRQERIPNSRQYFSRSQNPQLSQILEMSAQRGSSRDQQEHLEQDNDDFVKIEDIAEQSQQKPSPKTDKNWTEIPTNEHSSKKDPEMIGSGKKKFRTRESHNIKVYEERYNKSNDGEKFISQITTDNNRETLEIHGSEGKTTKYKDYKKILETKKYVVEGEVKKEGCKYEEKVEICEEKPDGEVIRKVETKEGLNENLEEQGSEQQFSPRPSILQLQSQASNIKTPPRYTS